MHYISQWCKDYVNKDLLKFFGICKDGRIRVIKISFLNEELTLEEYCEEEGSWEEDYTKFTPSMFVKKQPCFLFFRLDDLSESASQWIFIIWLPEDSCIKQKTMSALTEATLRKAFGSNQIKERLFATTTNEVDIEHVKRMLGREETAPPLLSAKEEIRIGKMSEAAASMSLNFKLKALNGLEFPISTDAMETLKELKEGAVNYVQLNINLDEEIINLELKGIYDVHSLTQMVPKEHPCYHLFAFSHSYEGDFTTSIVFIYTVPGFDCCVKERMLYSCGKQPLLDTIENIIGINIEKKIEIDNPLELTEQFLMDKIHPKTLIFKLKFPKPKLPGHCGPRRLIKRLCPKF